MKYAKYEVPLEDGSGEPFDNLPAAKSYALKNNIEFINVFDTETGELADYYYICRGDGIEFNWLKV